MPRCYLGLGGNLGNVAETFAISLRQLASGRDGVRLIRTSSLYRTAAIGTQSGDDFLNAAAEVETDLAPHDLLQQTKAVEASLGRSRLIAWGPRPIDVDLLLYAETVIDSADLVVPHPALWYRRFALDPLAEIAGNVLHPRFGQTIGELRSRLLQRPLSVQLTGGTRTLCDTLLQSARLRFPSVEFRAVETASQPAAAITAVLATDDSHRPADPATVSLPAEPGAAADLLSAVLTAATDEPQIVGGPLAV